MVGAGGIPISKTTGLLFGTAWSACVVFFGLRIILNPARYWAMWQKWLDQNQNDPNNWYTMRYDQIQDHVNTKNPMLKGRLLGLALIIVGVAVGLLITRVTIYGPFQ